MQKHFSFGFLPLCFFYPQAAGASTPSAPTNSTQPSVTSSNLTPTQPSANPTSIPESLPTHPDSTESSLTPDNGSPPSQPAEASATSSTSPGTGESATVRPISSPSVTPSALVSFPTCWYITLIRGEVFVSYSFCFLMSLSGCFHTLFHCLFQLKHCRCKSLIKVPLLLHWQRKKMQTFCLDTAVLLASLLFIILLSKQD